MKSSLLMHDHISVREIINSYKIFALFTPGHFKMQLAKQRIPKQAKSSTAKVKQICQEYLDESTATLAGDLQCNLSDMLVKCDKIFCEKPPKMKQHQGKLKTKSKSVKKQTFLQLDQVNFKKQVVSSFLAADIPFHKLNHFF